LFSLQRACSAVMCGSSAHLPSPRMPVVPLDRHSRRNFSTGSFAITICLLTLSTISASCRVLADCGLLNIPEICKSISETPCISEEVVRHSLSLMSTDRCSWQVIVEIQIKIIRSRNVRILDFRSGAVEVYAEGICVEPLRDWRPQFQGQPKHTNLNSSTRCRHI